MPLKRKFTLLEKIFICSLIIMHITCVIPLPEASPLTKKNAMSEAFAEEPPNNPPIIDLILPIAEDEGETIVLEPIVRDPDGDPVTITYEAPFDANGSWEIPYNYTGTDPTKTFTARITASDGTLQSFMDVNITINNKNAPPSVSITSSSYCVNANTNFTLHINANDPDGDTLTYELKEGARIIPVPPSNEVIENLSTQGMYKYTIAVADLNLETTIDTCYVEVINSETGPDDEFPLSGDFNGDGLTDIGTFTRNAGEWKVSVSNNGAFDNVQMWMSGFKGDNVERTYSVTGDFNGDGRTDIALFNADGGKWKFALSDGEKFAYESSWDITKFGVGDCAPLIGDFNGDGITDIGYSQKQDGNQRFWVKLAKKGQAAGFATSNTTELSTLNDSKTYSGDFNGDGMNDIAAFKQDEGTWRVALANDVESAGVVNWAAHPTSTLTGDIARTFGNEVISGAKEDIFDQDDITYWQCNGGGVGGGYGFTYSINMWVQSEFLSPRPINRIRTKFFAGGVQAGGGSYILEVYDSGVWKSVASSSWSGIQDFTVDKTNISYDNVTKIKITVSGLVHDYRPACALIAGVRIYELAAWGSDDIEVKNIALAPLSAGENWTTTSFGTNKDPVICDYNNDGKTDIGYFDKNTGEWHFALSDGTKFAEISGAQWPDVFGQGTDNLPSGGDYNGDGIWDAAVFNKAAHGVLNKWQIHLHNSKRPDLLTGSNNGIGGTTNIEYSLSTQFGNTGNDGKSDLPFPVPVVKKVTTGDSMGNAYATTYEYQDGMYESGSREFRGFKYVKVIDAEGTTKETQFNQDDIYKGRPQEEKVSDIYGRTYTSVQYDWDNIVLHGGNVTFPYLLSKTTTLYDVRDGTSRDIQTNYVSYDEYGNVRQVDELGFVDDPNDNKSILTDYEYNLAYYIVGQPNHITIKKGTDTVSETWHTYDSLGSLKEEKRWLNTGTDPISKFKYDYEANPNRRCGNIIETENALGRKVFTDYTAAYEYTFPTTLTNALLHTQSLTYDYKTGEALTLTDPNNQVTQTIYDGFGRILKVVGPNDTVSSPAIEYIYDLTSMPVKITTITKVDSGVTTTSYAFLDGLSRTIEIKTDAEDDPPGNPRQVISGVSKLDSRGQVKERYLPYFVSFSSTYTVPTYTQPKITYEYDPMGRVIHIINPDNTVSYMQYDGWTITAIDGNNNKIKSEKDAYERIIRVTEYESTNAHITDYTYDTLGNLTDTYDSASSRNHTHIDYDTLGRKIAMDDPDMGHWEYGYDAAGNLIWQEDNKVQIIGFKYDVINRLEIKGQVTARGDVPASGVMYEYDNVSPANPYAVGRFTKVTDTNGAAEFSYDNLGREIKTIKTIDSAPYEIQRTYDSIDRLKSVTYPDGEVITYAYNKGGGIETITSPAQNYITNINYGASGQMISVNYGNGAHTEYAYNVNTLRLTHLVTQSSAGIVQDLSYDFDNVGNVLSIVDNSGTGTNTQSFEYDDLNRPTKATGAGYGIMNYAYDSIGNMLTNGNVAMGYGIGAGPHAVTSYTKNSATYAITYDPNGNMLTKECASGVKAFAYDAENRLTEVSTPKDEYLTNYPIVLNAGWNFISMPAVVTEDIPTILQSSGITKAEMARYDAATQSWQHFAYEYGKDLSAYSDFTTFEYGKGYEVYVDTACTLKISGAAPLSDKTLELYAGWNLIAAPTTTSKDIADALSGITYDSIYERQGLAYVPATTLDAGKAYFLYVSNAQTWNIPREEDKTNYVYDGDGGRVKKIAQDETVTYVGSSYEKEDKNSNVLIKKHIFLGATRICTVEYDKTAPGTVDYYYIHQDHIGSSNIVTDKTGAVAKLIEYTPYGSTNREEGSYNTSYKFTGKLFDTKAALYYYGARYYDPELGRFIQPDPIIAYPDDPQCLNRYTYCRNNPVKYIDPSGNFWWIVAAIIGAIVGAVTGAISAASQGGNILLGAAFGAVVGAITGVATAGFAGVMEGAFAGQIISPVAGGLITGTEFAIGGFGTGLISGFAGGAGDIGDMFTQAGIGAAIGFGTGFIAGYTYTAGWQNVIHGMDTQTHNAQVRASQSLAADATKTMELELGSRPLGDPPAKENPRHMFGRWKEGGEYKYWEMGPDSQGKIAINPADSHNRTLAYISKNPSQVKWAKTNVSPSAWASSRASYEKQWVGKPYHAYWKNSNYAIRTAVYDAGGKIVGDLGWCPGGVHDLYGRSRN